MAARNSWGEYFFRLPSASFFARVCSATVFANIVFFSRGFLLPRVRRISHRSSPPPARKNLPAPFFYGSPPDFFVGEYSSHPSENGGRRYSRFVGEKWCITSDKSKIINARFRKHQIQSVRNRLRHYILFLSARNFPHIFALVCQLKSARMQCWRLLKP